jgi:hypothetical protein
MMPLAVFFCRLLDFRKNLLYTPLPRCEMSQISAMRFDKSYLTLNISVSETALTGSLRGKWMIN